MKTILSLLVLLGVTGTAMASPMVLGTSLDPTGIKGLVIDGTTYNVTFGNGSYNSEFGGSPATFLNNDSGAWDAAVAIGNALNANGVTGINGGQCAQLSVCGVIVPDYEQPNVVSGEETVWGSGSFEPGEFGTGPTQVVGLNFVPGWDWTYAVFAPAQSVPEPASLGLLAFGLAALALTRRKRPTA